MEQSLDPEDLPDEVTPRQVYSELKSFSGFAMWLKGLSLKGRSWQYKYKSFFFILMVSEGKILRFSGQSFGYILSIENKRLLLCCIKFLYYNKLWPFPWLELFLLFFNPLIVGFCHFYLSMKWNWYFWKENTMFSERFYCSNFVIYG